MQLDAIQTGYNYSEDKSFVVSLLHSAAKEFDRELFTLEHTGEYFEEEESQSWLCRVVLNEKNELSLVSTKESVLLNNEAVPGLLEYMPDKIIATLHPKSILIIEDWAVIRLIKENYGGNI